MQKPFFATQIAITLFAAAVATAQTAALSPFPLLRPDGTIPPGMPETGIYMDARRAHAVVFYRPDGGSGIRRFTVPIGSNVRATVSSRVEREGTNYIYTYVVRNDPAAKEPVTHLELNNSILRRPIALKSSNGMIPPGAAGEFRLVDSRKPGLVRVVARGSMTSSEPPADLPARIKEQLSVLRQWPFQVQQPSYLGLVLKLTRTEPT